MMNYMNGWFIDWFTFPQTPHSHTHTHTLGWFTELAMERVRELKRSQQWC